LVSNRQNKINLRLAILANAPGQAEVRLPSSKGSDH